MWEYYIFAGRSVLGEIFVGSISILRQLREYLFITSYLLWNEIILTDFKLTLVTS